MEPVGANQYVAKAVDAWFMTESDYPLSWNTELRGELNLVIEKFGNGRLRISATERSITTKTRREVFISLERDAVRSFVEFLNEAWPERVAFDGNRFNETPTNQPQENEKCKLTDQQSSIA